MRRQWFLILLCGIGFLCAVAGLKQQPRQFVASEIQVALPLFVQVGVAGGDRYLAANLATIRALVTNTAAMQPDEYKVLAKVQQDAAWLNPAHEDNYYIAAAILPWNAELEAAQDVLLKASVARPYDFQPTFLYAFNVYYFQQQPLQAADWLRTAAAKLGNDDDRLALENLAAKWADKGENLDAAIALVKALAQQAKRKDFRHYLEMRIQRLQDLKVLRTQAEIFKQRHGRAARSLDELHKSGLIRVVPTDPFGLGYEIDGDGQVQFRKVRP